MAYTGVLTIVESAPVSGGVFTVSSGAWSFNDGWLNGRTVSTYTVSCDCALSCICCCVTPTSGPNTCCGSLQEFTTPVSGDCDTGGGPTDCPGSADLCTACDKTPHTRSIHSCNNSNYRGVGVGNPCVQLKTVGTATCVCGGRPATGNCVENTGQCLWIANTDGCTTVPFEGC